MILFLICWLVVPNLTYAVAIEPAKIKLEQGQKEVIIPIEIKTGLSEKVSGVQFDINIPTWMTISQMTVGTSAQQAGKMVSFNQINRGIYRTIIAGLNQESIQSGTLVFVHIKFSEGMPQGKEIIKLTNPVIADPEGNSLPCTTFPGEISTTSESNSTSEPDKQTKNTTPPQQGTTIDQKTTSNIRNKPILFIIITLIILFLLTTSVLYFKRQKKEPTLPKKKKPKKK